MVKPDLLLQKSFRNSKSKDHLEVLKRRLNLWKEGKLMELFIEGENIQKPLSEIKSFETIAGLFKKFKNYTKKGNVNVALKLPTTNMKDAILLIKNEKLNILKEKHPESKNTSKCITEGSPNHVCRYHRNDWKICHQNKRRI